MTSETLADLHRRDARAMTSETLADLHRRDARATTPGLMNTDGQQFRQ